MSISGLHVTMLSGLAFSLVNFAWRRCARLTLALPAVKAAAVAGLLGALAYALLAGFAVPAQRTVFMLAVVAAALLLGRATAASAVLSLALLVLLIDPWAVLAAGFWLSFGAVAIIMMVTVNRLQPAHWLVAWARVQWAVTLALAGVALPFDALLQFAQLLMAVCVFALEWLSGLPDAAWEQHAPPAWTVIVALIGSAIGVVVIGWMRRRPVRAQMIFQRSGDAKGNHVNGLAAGAGF